MAFYFIRTNNYCRKSVSDQMVADAFCDIISRTVRFMQAQKKFTVAVALILSASEKEENKVNSRYIHLKAK